MKQISLLIFFILLAHSGYSQSKRLDSLLLALKQCKVDSIKVNTLNALCELKTDYGEYNEAGRYAEQAKNLASSISYNPGIVEAYFHLGTVEYYCENLSSAFEWYINALKLSESVNYKYGIGLAKTSLGRILVRQNDKESAKSYFKEALTLFNNTNSKKGLCYLYNCMGNVFEDLDTTMYNFSMANRLAREIGNFEMEARTIVNIGVVYREQKKFKESNECYEKGLKLFEEIGNTDRLEWVYELIADNYYRQNSFKEAIIYLKKADELIQKYDPQKNNYTIYQGLADAYSKLNRMDSAYYYRLIYEAHLDSTKSGENIRKTKAMELQYLFNKQQELEKLNQERKDAMSRLIRNILSGGLSLVLIFALVFFRQRNNIKKEKHKSDELLENILPEKVANELKATGKSDAKSYNKVTVMFADIKGFTKISENLTPEELVAEIDYCFKAFDKIIMVHHLEKIKTIGDAYMCAGGLPEENTTHAIDTVNAALAIQNFMFDHQQERFKSGKEVFEIRIGIHTGNVVAGIVGLKKFAYDIWGDTVNIASRMESSGEVGKVNISGATYELVKDHFNCIYRGKIEAKNKGELDMYFVDGAFRRKA